MIKTLHIKNIALIEELEISFENGLNVLSGETGAGKTVIISSINFVLGAKADKTIIRYGEDSCEAEVSFDVSNNIDVINLLKEYEIDVDDEIVIRRKLTIDGKNTIKVNGVTVTLQMLKNITELICDVYGQSEHYSLLKESNQLRVLDSFIGDEIYKLLIEISEHIKSIKNLKQQLDEFGGDDKERYNKIDLLSFQINEIEQADLQDGEEEKLIERKKILNNIENIAEVMNYSHLAISDDNGISDIISEINHKMSSISNLSDKYQELADRIESVKIELCDLSDEFENIVDSLDLDGEELNFVEKRLDLIKTFKRKYGNTVSEILEYLENSKIELDNLNNYDQKSKEIQDTIKIEFNKLDKLYTKVSELRIKKSSEFSKLLENQLTTLGMKGAKFSINIQPGSHDVLNAKGVDKIEFLFSANSGEPLKTMSKIISGGEMSRFMLSMKVVSSSLPFGSTYIFDEIDAGISGKIAEIVAEKFALISKNMQVITISHLPQIVSFSDKSYLIEKIDNGQKTKTQILPLDYDGKLNEIIRITGNGDYTEISRIHAEEMVNRAKSIKESLL